MFHSHAHDHAHHGHTGHHHGGGDAPAVGSKRRLALRLVMAGMVALGAVLVACGVTVSDGEAVVITRFGDPVSVLTAPGLAWKWPMPVEATIPVDLRLRTSSTGQQDVGTRDGLRVLVQASVAWQVAQNDGAIRRYLRSVRNDPDEAARQLRTLLAASLQVTASSFDLSDLVNTEPNRASIAAFETQLQAQLERRAMGIYGIAIRQVGIERLGLPAETMAATVGRMRAEREVVAASVTTEGLRAAAAIRSDAERDARVTVARARTEAARLEADSQGEAARIHAAAYASDPSLYLLLRSLDTLGQVVGANTRLVLRTDAAPFHVLIEGPPTGLPAPGPGSVAGPPPAPAPPP